MKFAIRSLLAVAAATLPMACSLLGQNVITDWNTIASSTIVAHGGNGAGVSSVWFAYESIAVYDAVNSIHREFKPFYYDGRCDRDASEEAAAIAASHRVLVYYFPAQQAALDTSYNTSLGQLVTTPRAKADGLAVGEAAAQALIAARVGDGLLANVPYQPGSGPGVWQPTPPGILAAATPGWEKCVPSLSPLLPNFYQPDRLDSQRRNGLPTITSHASWAKRQVQFGRLDKPRSACFGRRIHPSNMPGALTIWFKTTGSI